MKFLQLKFLWISMFEINKKNYIKSFNIFSREIYANFYIIFFQKFFKIENVNGFLNNQWNFSIKYLIK